MKTIIDQLFPAFVKNKKHETVYCADMDIKERCEELVLFSTVHGAKGLEWPRVHIPSFISGHIPSTYTLDTMEEMRILYVATSRAKKDLFMYKPLFTANGGFSQTSEFEFIVKPHCNVVKIKKNDTNSRDRINSTNKIDMKAIMAAKLKKSQTV